MHSIFGAATRLVTRSLVERVSLAKNVVNNKMMVINKRWAHNEHLTYDYARERILLVLRLFDKIDPNKLTLDSHFVNDLGLDSLDHVEIIMNIEDEFRFEIPDKDAEKLVTPGHIVRYITDKEEAYEELQQLQAHHHHDGHDHDHHDNHHGVTAGNHHENNSTNPQTRGFCTWTAKRFMTSEMNKGYEWPTSFDAKKPRKVDIKDIQDRVMKVCSKYDKIDSSKLDLASHFVQDLGLDSLDHVEILMELEDEFGVEIPDQDAEKLMRPAEIAGYIFRKEEARAVNIQDRPF